MMITTISLLFCFNFQGAALRLPASGGEASAPKILFGVMTSSKTPYTERVNVQMKTWMTDLTPEELVIIGTDAPKGMEARAQWINASECNDNHGVGLSCKEMTLESFANNLDIDWLWVLNDDHYAMKDAVQYAVRDYDPNIPQILGTPGCATKHCGGMCGGAGELISRGALKHMVENGDKSFRAEFEETVPTCENWCDISTSTVAKHHGVELKSIRGVYGWRKESKEIQKIIDQGVNMETSPLLFHYVSIDQMEQIHSLVKQHKKQSPKPSLFKAESSAFTKAWQNAYDAEAATYVADQNSRRYSKVADPVPDAEHLTLDALWNRNNMFGNSNREQMSIDDPAFVRIDDNTETTYFSWPAWPLGNSLFVYWEARASAACRNQDFVVQKKTNHALLDQFPQVVKASSMDDDMIEKCKAAATAGGYAHASANARWRLSSKLIQDEIKEVSKKVCKSQSWAAAPQDTVALHIRCDDYILKFHSEYGLLPHQYFEKHIPLDTHQIVIVGKSETVGAPPNTKSAKAVWDLKKYLEARHPGVNVTLGTGSTNEIDEWCFLNKAKKLILSPSTFSLSAALGNLNTVIYPAVNPQLIPTTNTRQQQKWGTSPFPSNFNIYDTQLLGGQKAAQMSWPSIRDWLRNN